MGSESTTMRAEREANVAPEGAKKTAFRPDIQGLRAVAVVVVILDHLLAWPRGGFIGVDLFFVISGYLITGLLLREFDKTGGISFSGFYIRRFKRIFPAATLVLISTVAAAWFLTPGDRFERTVGDAIWATFFAANWNMGLQGTDYFQADMLPSPLQHYWSLSVEEQFYFVWPWVILLVLLVMVRVRRSTFGQTRAALAVAIGVLSLASFAYGYFLTQTDPAWAYFSSFTRAWELGFGALVAIISPWLTMPRAARIALSLVGLIGIGVSLFVITPASGFPVPGAALPVVCIAAVLVAGEKGSHGHLFVLSNPVSGYLGNISYSLYLWHFPLMIMMLALLPKDLTFYLIYGVAVVLISAASYHFVEDPIRRWKPARSRRRRRNRSATFGTRQIAILTVGVLALGGLATAALLKDASYRIDPQSVVAATAAPTASSAATPEPCFGAAALDPTYQCASISPGSGMAPAAAQASKDRDDACWMDEHETLASCHYGSEDPGALRIALVGDSHAHHFIPGLALAAQERGWSLDTYTGVSCLLTTTVRDACDGAQTAIIDALTAQPYDVVLTSAARTKSEDPANYASMFSRLEGLGSRVIVLADVPPTSDEGVLCYQRVGFSPSDTSCGAPLSQEPADSLVTAAASVPGSKVVDLSDMFCKDDWCPAVVGNVIVYRDSKAHITATFSRTLAPYLGQRIADALA
ncbi:acyltransferase family protein [Microbacterium proteolyticum]|uniref:acyltransferase family protein n=1 Tax=Microbacterium proteolyticum TaxID=1572644 RepID=UPI002415E06B|nr:acyltransferase family protein [Microbacterium proteolyticum]